MKKYYGYIFVLPAVVYAAVAFAQGMPFFMPKGAMKNQTEKLPSVESMRRNLEQTPDYSQYDEDDDYTNSQVQSSVYDVQPESNIQAVKTLQYEPVITQKSEPDIQKKTQPQIQTAEAEKNNKSNNENVSDNVALSQNGNRPDLRMSEPKTQTESVTVKTLSKEEPGVTKTARNNNLDFGFTMDMDLNGVFDEVLKQHTKDLQDIKHGRYTGNDEVKKVSELFTPHEYRINKTIYPRF